jgi:hypothetical protein
MKPFKSYFIGIAVTMALVLGLAWWKGGTDLTRTLEIFFMGWLAGAASMFIKAKIVYKP